MAITQEIIDNFDFIIQETGNTHVSLRKVKWSENSEPKYDLRKYIIKPDGSEMIHKGVSFTDEGANELTKVLCEQGLGDTKEIVNAISDREDFIPSVCRVLSDDNRELLQGVFPDMDFSEPEDSEEDYIDIRNEMGA